MVNNMIKTMNDYEAATFSQAYYPGMGTVQGINYCLIALAGEGGEALNEWKKALRDDKTDLTDPKDGLTLKRRNKIIEEVGDCLWYVTALARELGITLEELANRNFDKIRERQAPHNMVPR